MVGIQNRKQPEKGILNEDISNISTQHRGIESANTGMVFSPDEDGKILDGTWTLRDEVLLETW